MDLKMYFAISRILFQKDSSYKSPFSTKDRATPKLVSRIPGVSGSNQNVETPYNTKLKLPKLEDLCFRTTEKLAKMSVCYSQLKTLKF